MLFSEDIFLRKGLKKLLESEDDKVLKDFNKTRASLNNDTLYVDSAQNKNTDGVAWATVVDGNGDDMIGKYHYLFEDMSIAPKIIKNGTTRNVALTTFADVMKNQNNGGELLAMVMGLRIAYCNHDIRKVCSDSDLIVKYWSKGVVKSDLSSQKLEYIKECIKLRKEFEKRGGIVEKVDGCANLADCGWHK